MIGRVCITDLFLVWMLDEWRTYGMASMRFYYKLLLYMYIHIRIHIFVFVPTILLVLIFACHGCMYRNCKFSFKYPECNRHEESSMTLIQASVLIAGKPSNPVPQDCNPKTIRTLATSEKRKQSIISLTIIVREVAKQS